jgi:hypothetical protein
MSSPQLSFRAGFWDGIAWGAPDSPVRALCAKCHGLLSEEEIPLMLCRKDGAMIQLCETCVDRWLTAG